MKDINILRILDSYESKYNTVDAKTREAIKQICDVCQLALNYNCKKIDVHNNNPFSISFYFADDVSEFLQELKKIC